MDKTENTLNKSYFYAWIMFWVTASFYFYDFLLRMAPSVMMDQIITSYNIKASKFGLLESSFYFMYTPLQIIAGPIIDEYGNRKVLPIAIICCFFGSLLSALEISFAALLFARMLIGLGSAFAFIAVLKTASEWLPKKHYPFISGLTTALGSIGGITAEVVLPKVAHFGIPVIYTALSIIALVILFLSLLFVQDREDHSNIKSLNLEILLKDIFIIISKKQFWIIGGIGCFLFSPIQIFVVWAKSFFMQVLMADEQTAGHIVSMIFWGLAIGAPISGWVASIFDNKKNLLYIGSFFSLASISVLLSSNTWTNSQAAILVFLIGFFIGVQQLVFVYAKNLSSLHLTATSIAATNMIVNLSSYVQPFIGDILDLEEKTKINGIYSFSSWQTALMIVPILLFLSIILIYFLEDNIESNQDT